ncbi:MBL fold metallo-hydrolase [Thermocrinis minervae]|uniref:Glyoxylase, beta-lactamase superfamily II n=1 Tax=Thermocrinis minervae TaxID=381751 RepID=A0A1M6Q2R4_9AQUI|nr:MBL fold metallo-hydrolase [Thermocrinis minervae]SHK14366.1 Glyoxylase, beta-lactamase superfamily II [Thermocrinis minervae]
MLLKVLSVGPLSVNCSILLDEERKEALVIDPGADASRIIEELKDFKLVGILATHGHIDHVGVVKTLKERTDAIFYMNEEDLFLLEDTLWPGFDRYIGAELPCPEPDISIREGDTIKFGSVEIRVLHTPGHTPGLCCFYIPQHSLLIAGDLLFRGGVGRWDLPGGDLQALKKSLRRVFEELPDDTLVVTGHYDKTTIGHERVFNPYLRELL